MTSESKPRKQTQHTIPLDRPEPIQSELAIALPEPEPTGDLARDDDDEEIDCFR
jgi:hypothetical protein